MRPGRTLGRRKLKHARLSRSGLHRGQGRRRRSPHMAAVRGDVARIALLGEVDAEGIPENPGRPVEAGE